jgi:uncharacterized protein YqhQ
MVFNGQLFLWLTVAFISTSKSINRLTHFYVVKSAAVEKIGEKPEVQSLKIYKQKSLHMRLSLKYIISYTIFAISLILIIQTNKILVCDTALPQNFVSFYN